LAQGRGRRPRPANASFAVFAVDFLRRRKDYEVS
jgi:hypothetical protein